MSRREQFLESMLRMYVLQEWFWLFDRAVEDAIISAAPTDYQHFPSQGKYSNDSVTP